jgi:hypothetical protein
VLLARGDWPALRDLAARTDQLVTDHPDTAFCYAVTTTRAFGLVACALQGDAAGARALLPHVETPLQAEPFERESLLALVYGALGRRDALHALADPLNPPGTPFWFFQRTYVVALTMLEAWEDLEAVLPPLERVAGEGSPYLAALLEAIREEVAEARGTGPPAHDALRRLGYEGWSQLLSHRPRL